MVEQVQACKSSNDHHKSNDCSGEEEQEVFFFQLHDDVALLTIQLHAQREIKKAQCMEILFPKKDELVEVSGHQVIEPVQVIPDPPVDEPHTNSAHITRIEAQPTPEPQKPQEPDIYSQLLQQLQQQNEMIVLLQAQLKEVQQRQPKQEASDTPIKSQPTKQSSSAKSSATSYFLIIIIFGIFILHLLFYVFALSRVINNNTEQMKKMVSILTILEAK